MFLAVAAVFVLLGIGTAIAAEQPHTIIHVITIKWKDDATPEQIDKVLQGAVQLANEYPGIRRVWTKSLKVQGAGYKNAIVMEFASEATSKAYADAPAHKEWEKLYVPLRGESTTHDVTN